MFPHMRRKRLLACERHPAACANVRTCLRGLRDIMRMMRIGLRGLRNLIRRACADQRKDALTQRSPYAAAAHLRRIQR